MMSEEIILANAKLVLPEEIVTGSLKLLDGVIVDIAQGCTVTSGAFDCENHFLAPGLIDLHTDNLERYLEPRYGMEWPSTHAVLAYDAHLFSAGITTVFDALRIGMTPVRGLLPTPYARRLATDIRRLSCRNLLKTRHFLHLRAELCSETLEEEIADFSAEDQIKIISIMNHTPGLRQFRDIPKMRAYLMRRYGFSNDEYEQYIKYLHDLHDRKVSSGEKKLLRHATRFGSLLASHDDTSLQDVIKSREQGVCIAEFPTTVEAAKACRDAGIHIMMGAPNLILGKSHSGNVSAHELMLLDLLDILSSDYIPSSLLQAAIKAGSLLGNMARGLAMATRNPARAVHLTDCGSIEIGARTDLIRFDIQEGWGRLLLLPALGKARIQQN